jgi:hypothetical protein
MAIRPDSDGAALVVVVEGVEEGVGVAGAAMMSPSSVCPASV